MVSNIQEPENGPGSDQIADPTAIAATADIVPDRTQHPPELHWVFYGCALAFVACFALPLVRFDGNLLRLSELQLAFSYVGRPLRWLGYLLYVPLALGVLAAVVARTVGCGLPRLMMWTTLAAGLSPFVAMGVALYAGAGFVNLWNSLHIGACMLAATGAGLIVVAIVDQVYRNAPRVPLLEWTAVSGPEYKVGTLAYTRLGLIVIFFWLLWGDMVFKLSEAVYPASIVFQLERIGVAAQWMSILTLTIPNAINFILVPIISFRSDRTRSRWGRRIPYIAATMVPLCFFMWLNGFSDSIAHWAYASAWPGRLHLAPMTAILLVLGTLMMLFNVFNVFVNVVFWYLFRDVIPDKYLARFMATFGMVGTVGGLIWNLCIYPYVEIYTRQIYLGGALLYFFGFGIMCLMVKEGQYPPVTDEPRGQTWLIRVWNAIVIYAKECFTHPLFLLYYAFSGMLALANVCGMYKQLFMVRDLGFSLRALGLLGGLLGIIALVIQFPLGWLVDRWHPMRTLLFATTAVIPLHFAGFFLRDYHVAGFLISAFSLQVSISLITLPLSTIGGLSGLPLEMRIYPGKQFGQFAAAGSNVRSFTVFFASMIGGAFISLMTKRHGAHGWAYAYLWHGTFQTVGAACLWAVYFIWKRHGGESFKFDPENPDLPAGRPRARGFDVVLKQASIHS